MKKLLMAIAIITSVSACTPSSVGAGEEGVMIYKPYIFGSGGVYNDPIETGLTWTAMSTEVVRYDIKPVKFKESFVDLTASDNVAIDFDSYLTLKIIAGKTPLLHEKSGEKWYSNKVQDFYRQEVRNEFRTRTSIELRTDPSVILNTQVVILNRVRAYLKDIEIPVEAVKVVTGKVVPPREVLTEAAATAAEKQKIKTQTARNLTEIERAKAETSSALADKAYATEFNMTTEQFLRNKELDIMSAAAKSGTVTLLMNASSAQPMIVVK